MSKLTNPAIEKYLEEVRLGLVREVGDKLSRVLGSCKIYTMIFPNGFDDERAPQLTLEFITSSGVAPIPSSEKHIRRNLDLIGVAMQEVAEEKGLIVKRMNRDDVNYVFSYDAEKDVLNNGERR